MSKSALARWLIGVPLGVLIACSGSSGGGGGSAGTLSRRGESCQTRRDCETGLACVNQVCEVDHFGVPASQTQCAQVQCIQGSDCCPNASASICQQLKAACDAGSVSACDQYKAQCTCPADCVNGKCVEHCSPTEFCNGGKLCNGTTCVNCLCDTDCGSGHSCRGGQCYTSCDVDLDCAPMQSCQTGVCVESGCTADRECIASLDNVLAVCRNAVCEVTCSTDLECDSPTNFGFSACINGLCTDLGCQSDEECRALYKQPPQSVPSSRSIRWLCSMKACPSARSSIPPS